MTTLGSKSAMIHAQAGKTSVINGYSWCPVTTKDTSVAANPSYSSQPYR